ncbi:barstar family protein [Kitasatospora sp. NPDC092039]|uniref:barstar family protein n=1 Tax=Kitasatospora sp. NPDC092039 TaxID=3364086 RepID=UPI0037F27855
MVRRPEEAVDVCARAASVWDLLPGRAWAGLAAGTHRLRLVRGANCRTTAALFTEWAHALAFPGYFGHNWDAFEECLRDALHPPGAEPTDAAGGLLVLVTDADALLADEPPDRLALLLAVLDAAATAPAADAPLRVLFTTAPPEATPTRSRLRSVGRTG